MIPSIHSLKLKMSHPSSIPLQCFVSTLKTVGLMLSANYYKIPALNFPELLQNVSKYHNFSTFKSPYHVSQRVPSAFRNSASTTSQRTDSFRGSRDYEKNIWDHDFVHSLQVDYEEDILSIQVEELKEKVKDVLNDETLATLTKLVFINDMQRLGLGFHFEKETQRALNVLYNSTNESICDSLHTTALYFRVLRQNGYRVSQDVFNDFKDKEGNFRIELCQDVDGMLNLYEASHLGLEGENILHEAKNFTIKHLKVLKNDNESNLVQEVNQALELPLHLRMPRLEARDYMDAYRTKRTMNPNLLELADMDVILLQATYRKELKKLSRWWKHLGLPDKLSFARDRLVEGFLWSLGLADGPQNQRCREWITKVVAFIVTIDDIYDIYGSLEELELFTSAVDRWDVKAIEQLPDYMQLCFLGLFNTTHEFVYTQYKDHGAYILPYLKKVWTDFCKAMLLEAKWNKMGYTPSLVEYLENAWISSSTTVGLVHAFFASEQTITNDVLESLNNSDLIYYSAMIYRLCNDLATSSEELARGEIASAIQCYMHEADTLEQVARQKIKELISEMWKKLNESIYDSPFHQSFVDIAINHARTSQTIYHSGDGMTIQDHEAKKRVMQLLITP